MEETPKLIDTKGSVLGTVNVYQWGDNDFSVEFGDDWSIRGGFLEIVEEVAEGIHSVNK